MSRDFWLSCGHHLLERSEGGGLLLTDEFLKAYLARPELMPPEEACAAERALHARLLADPRAAVSAGDAAALADPDAAQNWRVMLAFRDALLASPTLEAAYIRLVRDGLPGQPLPPLFLNQLTHVIMRNALDGCEDAFVARAGELFYRTQRAAFEGGGVLLADAETAEAETRRISSSPLLSMFAGETANLEVLREDVADAYWARSDAYDMVLSLDARGRGALATALEGWTRHLLGVAVEIEPLERIEDRDVRWIAGLDAEGTRLGNALWRGDEIDDAAARRLIAIFALRSDAAPFVARMDGRPAYLLLACADDRLVRMKPHNLIVGLPLTGAPN
ncbi:MAG: DUF6352 family protein [Hyphomicrobiales bacterium]|nr:DUF6352 family protein [Hyphomicrobiales bacterium]